MLNKNVGFFAYDNFKTEFVDSYFLLIGVIGWVYCETLGCQFVNYHDGLYVVNNPHVIKEFSCMLFLETGWF